MIVSRSSTLILPKFAVFRRLCKGVAVAGVAAAVAGVAVLVPAPASAATEAPSMTVQGESFTVPDGTGSVYADPNAIDGQALAIWNNATATRQVTTATGASQITVRAMGGACDGRARMGVTVDGVAATFTVDNQAFSSWEDHQFHIDITPGTHTIGVAFLNEYGNGACDRFLEVDQVTLKTMPIWLEAEHTPVPASVGTVVDDSLAYREKAVKITSGALTIPFAAYAGFDNVALRARGGACGNSIPIITLAVDGKLLSFSPSDPQGSTSYSLSTKPPTVSPWHIPIGRHTKFGAGNHTATITLTNPYTDAATGCTRAAYLDIVQVSRSETYTDPTTPPASGFLTRSGTSLMLGGKAFKYAGMNAYGMSGCDNGSVAWTDAQLDDYFSRLAPNTITRTWAFQPYGTAALDRIVARAAAHHQKVVFSLADGRNDCEKDGWAGSGQDKTVAWYTGGFRTNYLPWVREVVNRYKANPTVAMWELINEPGSWNNAAITNEIMRAFFDETAGVIKGIDGNHLVTTGALSADVNGTRDYAYVHGGSNIDVVSLHEYEYDYEEKNAITPYALPALMTAARSIDKPMIIGETGLWAGAADKGCRTSAAGRAGVIRQKLDAFLAVDGLAGAMVWGTVLYNPAEHFDPADPCPYEFAVSDPSVAVVKAKQAALNG
jgi:hypothetical protein